MIEVRRIRIPELPTKKPRRLYIYLPKGYESSDKRYPVLYMFDGHNLFYDSHATYGKSWGMREYLNRSKKELILVGVECNPEGFRRIFEYSPWDFKAPRLGEVKGLGRTTMEWFVNTLKPAIDAEFRTLPEREHTMIAGSSMGGIMSIYALVEYNSVFSRAAALSPSLWVSPKGLRELIASRPLYGHGQRRDGGAYGAVGGRVQHREPPFEEGRLRDGPGRSRRAAFRGVLGGEDPAFHGLS